MFGLHQKNNPQDYAYGLSRAVAAPFEVGLRQLHGIYKGASPNSQQHQRVSSAELIDDKSADSRAASMGSVRAMDSRRVWVRREKKTATAITVGPNTIVDDLKYMISERFPNSLARQCDPSDLTLVAKVTMPRMGRSNSYTMAQSPLSPASGSIPSSVPMSSADQNGTQAPNSVNSTSSYYSTELVRSSSLGPTSSNQQHMKNQRYRMILEPDLSLYTFLDTYFPEGMVMRDAISICTPDTSSHHTPSTAMQLQLPPPTHSDKLVPTQTSRQLPPPRKTVGLHVPPTPTAPQSSTVILFPKTSKESPTPRLAEPIKLDGSTTIGSPSHHTNSASTLTPTLKSRSYDANPGVTKILSHINVLVIEDNLVNQKIMGRHLESCGVKYKIASTGERALELWKEGGFHLCFMDIQLPVMSGIDVTKEIRRLERYNRIGNFANSDESERATPSVEDKLDLNLFQSPIIIVALTASNTPEDKQKALAAGCNDYLTKPVQLRWLRSKLTEWGCMQALINYDEFRKDD